MDKDEIKREAIANIVNLLEEFPFTLEFCAKAKPKGIRVILELTQEQLDNILGKKR
jgi:hypothetical protein